MVECIISPNELFIGPDQTTIIYFLMEFSIWKLGLHENAQTSNWHCKSASTLFAPTCISICCCSHPTMLKFTYFILLTLAIAVNSQDCNWKKSYKLQSGIKCTSQVSVGSMTRGKCLAACSKRRDDLCHVFNHTGDMNCELCFGYYINSTTGGDAMVLTGSSDPTFEEKLQESEKHFQRLIHS